MIFSKFEYSLAFISILLIITIVTIVLYKKYEDNVDEYANNKYVNQNTYKDITDLKVNTDMNMNMNMNMDMNMGIENFETYSQSNIDAIVSNNTNISALISSINDLNKNNPSVNILYETSDIDNNLQNKIADLLNEKTDDLISNTRNGTIRINNKITKLSNQITDLENIITRLHLKNVIKPNYSKIKSLNNGAEITLTQTPKTFYVEPSTGVDTPAYMVNLNEGCLSVGAIDYDVYKCNESNNKHLFQMEHIINESGYQKNIDKTVPFNSTDLSTITYPFVLMRSVNNKNCLTNQNGNITVQPCDSLTAQRWLPI